jgi:hypothetical protein
VFTEAQVLALCSELNHILWTEDTPDFGTEISKSFPQGEKFVYQPKGNMQCCAHACVCAGLMWRQGEKVTTRAGSALVVFPEQRKHDSPFFIAKHWWITTSNGLLDLSLNLSGISIHKPIIFHNKNLADPNWRVAFKDDFARIFGDSSKCRAEGNCGVFYQTDKKLVVTKELIEPDLLKPFSAAKSKNLSVSFLDIILHCERFLNGGESLKQLPQEIAWQVLSKRT